MVADPSPTPATRTTEVGPVCPAGIRTVEGETVTLLGSLDARLMNTSCATGFANGSESVIGSVALSPGATVSVAGITMPVGCVTVTVAVASATLGALARHVPVPAVTPVTGIAIVVAPAANGTAVTVTMAGQ